MWNVYFYNDRFLVGWLIFFSLWFMCLSVCYRFTRIKRVFKWELCICRHSQKFQRGMLIPFEKCHWQSVLENFEQTAFSVNVHIILPMHCPHCTKNSHIYLNAHMHFTFYLSFQMQSSKKSQRFSNKPNFQEYYLSCHFTHTFQYFQTWIE